MRCYNRLGKTRKPSFTRPGTVRIEGDPRAAVKKQQFNALVKIEISKTPMTGVSSTLSQRVRLAVYTLCAYSTYLVRSANVYCIVLNCIYDFLIKKFFFYAVSKATSCRFDLPVDWRTYAAPITNVPCRVRAKRRKHADKQPQRPRVNS